jgi:hypothetical protein
MLQAPERSRKEVSQMFARVTTVRSHVQDLDPGIVFARDQLVPKLQHHQGFEGTMLMVDRTVPVALAITFWTSKEDLAASREDAQQLTEMAEQAFDVQVDVRECAVAFSTFAGLTSTE